MSGHSKWSTIKRKKGAEDARRSRLFTRLVREIVTAAREGGGIDIDSNPRLRLAVDKAKAANMPKDNIERAIKKGAGIGDDGTIFEEILYEGYGPHGVAVLVETVTDNRNRTLAGVKHAFNKAGGSLAQANAVAWQFDQKGYIQIDGKGVDFDEAFLVAADAGAEDVIAEDGLINIYTVSEDLFTVAHALQENGFKVTESQLTWIPKNEVALSPDQSLQVLRLLEVLEELDDVDNVASNLEMSDDAIAAFESA
ncbi:MAG TPA: YebC/PmpR family DNA-binding transcriptional regulator [Aggregatilineales bacterium]|nr:YebC/PmpR family DNA-binding transcriptional regulator [Aggregatilineales bacterium]